MSTRRTLVSFARRRSAAIGAALVCLIVLAAILAPTISRHDPVAQDLTQRMLPPSGDHWLGTDNFGRDMWSRIVWGSRISIMVAVVATLIGSALGMLVGLIAGYVGGAADHVLMRTIDVMMAFPTLLLAITIVAVLGGGILNLMLAIGIASVAQFSRVARSDVLRIRALDYVHAARAMGASTARIVALHLVPNVMSSMIVLMTLRVSVAILAEASLSFLGLGVRPPTPSWGNMVAEGRDALLVAPAISIVPGVAIAMLVLALNLFGDGLRDALDPRLRDEGRHS